MGYYAFGEPITLLKVDVYYCNKKIDHLNKVTNKLILLKGRATRF